MPKSSPPDTDDFEAEVRRLSAAILAEDAAEAKAAYHLRMRARGVQDLGVLRAFETVPRPSFVAERYQDLAARELAIPIGCGQTLDEPWLVARMIEALGIEASDRVLQIGSGSGFATVILALLAREVLALERYQSLATSGAARLEALGVPNATIQWSDGLAVSRDHGRFQRIIVHGLLAEIPEGLTDRLAYRGIFVGALGTRDGQNIVRAVKTAEGLVPTVVCPCRLQPIVPGLAALAR